MAWTAADIPSLQGRTALVTGATDGLGLLGAARVYGVALIAAAGFALAVLYQTRRAPQR